MQREYLYDRPGVSGRAGSTWLADRERPTRPPLAGIVGADAVVIGAGLCGVLTAVRLAEQGARVALIEGRRIGGLVTGHTTAKVTAQHGLVSSNVSSDAREPWLRANISAVDQLEKLSAWAGDSARFERVDSHVYTTDQQQLTALEREAALYRSCGLAGGLVPPAELPEGMLGAVRLDRQAQFDPVGLIDGLLDGAPASLSVFEQSRVRSVEEQSGVVVAHTDAGEARADVVIVASHVPFFDTLLYMTRLFQERSYALEVEIPHPAPAGLWFSQDPEAVYWRTSPGRDAHRLIMSGVHHKAGQGGNETKCYAKLERLTRERFGPEVKVVRHWSTQDAHTPDGLPYIGKMHGKDRCYMASGFQGWGMSTSMVAADVLSALASGEEHELTDLLSPARVRAGGMVKLAVENADVVAKAFSHELAAEGDPDSLAPGSGLAMRFQGEHVAAMRDEAGHLHLRDAHCTHMRCAVEFNEAEGTWDCPCHGSRYYGNGDWLQGPTRRGLEPVKEERAGDDGG